jgi:phage terminase large subunit-like protein
MSSMADYRETHRALESKVASKIAEVAEKFPEDAKLRRKAQLAQIVETLELAAKNQIENRLKFYKPYPKQLQFHEAGATVNERLLMAGNQTGKSWCGGAETAIHFTGIYPEWWTGRRFDRPIRGWAAGVTGESTRDIIQRILIGTKAEGYGTGMIPKSCLDPKKMTLARGVPDLLDTILIKHVSGGFSELKLKSYEKGQEKWQGDTLDFLWFDEEPPLDVYTEGFTRTVVKNGLIMITFTPLQGMSEVVRRFLFEKNEGRRVTSMEITDAEHIPAERRAAIVAGYPEHEREARAKGIPVLGSGAVFPVSESQITCEPFRIPDHWSLLWGMDYGVSHPFAAVLVAWNRDTDTVYVVHTIRLKGATSLQHAASMKTAFGDKGGLIPVAWPHDVNQRREFEGSLTPLRDIYKKHGLAMRPTHASFVDGSLATEIGIMAISERMNSGRFKVFTNCTDWFQEFRTYHRKEGVIVKEDDDIMSATRQAIMDLRFAKPILYTRPTFGSAADENRNMAKGLDFDPWAR